MNRLISRLSVAVLAVQTISVAQASTCSRAIEDLRHAASLSRRYPDAGPTAPQSVGAQLGHQPTPRSVATAEAAAQSAFAALLARATAFDAVGRSGACLRAVEHARQSLVSN